MPHELTHEQNRVAVVNSVITKILNLCKYWTVTIQPFHKTLNHSVPVLFNTSFIVWLLFVFPLLFKSGLFVWSFSIRLYNVFSVLILELHSWYFDPITPYTTTIQQSINIIQRHLCLSIGSQRPIKVDIEDFWNQYLHTGLGDDETCTILSSARAGAILYLGSCSSKLVENLLNRMFGDRLLQDFDN